MAAQQSNATSATATGTASASVNPTRSVRNSAGTPVSARAAARKPVSGDAGSDDDAKAEMQAQLADLQAKLAESEASISSSQKQAEVLQIKLDEALKEQSLLEDNVHEHTERIEELENERREKERGRREMEQIYEAERAANMKEKEESLSREEEMQHSIIRMKEALQAREIRHGLEDAPQLGERGSRMSLSRTSSHRLSNSHSPVPPEFGSDGGTPRQFAPSSLQRSDSRSSSRLVMQKDKIIADLRMELAEVQIKLVELENKGGGHVQVLEKEMYDLKIQNARLMEENESFQLLLQEKALNGDLLRAPSEDPASRPPSSRNVGSGGASLADELPEDETNSAHEPDSAAPDSAGPESSKERRLQHELNTAKDQNKALTLYINNIISRLLQHEQFEAILDQTPDLMAGPGAASRKYATAGVDTEKELPPPPPLKDDKPLPNPAVQGVQADDQPQGFLQRAGSVLKRARPQSVIQQPTPQVQVDAATLAALEQPTPIQATVHNNPTTAPQIPLSRNRSTRQAPGAAGAHRRSASDWPAASVVTNMYKGPSPGPSGPLSPGLGSPTGGRGSPFFAMGGRQASGSSVPTISEAEKDKENAFPGPVNYIPSGGVGNRSSVQSLAPADAAASGSAEVSSNPSSPPRSTTSSNDRESQAGGGRLQQGGSVMMGSKPRPLRLVQESAAEDEKARKTANRSSWFASGWKNLQEAGQRAMGAASPPNAAVGSQGATPPTAPIGGMERFMPARTYSGDSAAADRQGSGSGQGQGQGQ